MSIKRVSCVVIVCDGSCGGGWDDGALHFDNETHAVEYARSQEWVVTGDRALCPTCAHAADCRLTGHRLGDWGSTRELAGVRFRTRWCDHCDHTEYDPPYEDLAPRLAAVREAERIVSNAAPTTGGQP